MKIINHQLRINKANQKSLFSIRLPQDVSDLVGIELGSNLHVPAVSIDKYAQQGLGKMYLYVADRGECLYSELLHIVSSFPTWESGGNYFAHDKLWMQNTVKKPFATKQPIQATRIDGFYQDLIHADPLSTPDYTVTITLYFQ